MIKTELQFMDATYSVELATRNASDVPAAFTTHLSYRGTEPGGDIVWHRWDAVEEDVLEAIYEWFCAFFDDSDELSTTYSAVGNSDGPPVLVIADGEVAVGDTVVLALEDGEQGTVTVTDVSRCSITIDWYGHGTFLLELGSDDKFYAATGDDSPIEVTRV